MPALVLEELERMGRAANAQRKAQQIAETIDDELELDPVAQTSGKQMIESVRRKLSFLRTTSGACCPTEGIAGGKYGQR